MNKIPKDISEEIQERFKTCEKEHNVKILFGVESWSRAWWFESKNSDFDVRFIYKHKIEYYLSIDKKRDVIEYPILDEIDINGWDIKKTLYLFQKWNPSFSEWIKSPIIYRKNDEFQKNILEIETKYFSPKNYIYHYLHMAKRNFREYLKKDEVRIKKYFYVLRPVLACLWIEKYNYAPPMEFQKLYDDCELISPELREEIDVLIMRKKSWDELDSGNKIKIINEFLDKQMKLIEERASKHHSRKIPVELLDEIFRKNIFNEEIW